MFIFVKLNFQLQEFVVLFGRNFKHSAKNSKGELILLIVSIKTTKQILTLVLLGIMTSSVTI